MSEPFKVQQDGIELIRDFVGSRLKKSRELDMDSVSASKIKLHRRVFTKVCINILPLCFCSNIHYDLFSNLRLTNFKVF